MLQITQKSPALISTSCKLSFKACSVVAIRSVISDCVVTFSAIVQITMSGISTLTSGQSQWRELHAQGYNPLLLASQVISVALQHMVTVAWPLLLFLICFPVEGVSPAPLVSAVLLSLAYQICTGLHLCSLLNFMKSNLWYWLQPLLAREMHQSTMLQCVAELHVPVNWPQNCFVW